METDGSNQTNEELPRPASGKLWIKDSTGAPSASLTFATIAFIVTTIAYVIAMIDHIGSVSIRAFDVGACSAYMLPILALYFGRRFTTAKYETPSNVIEKK